MQLQAVQITSCTLTNIARTLQKEVYLPHLRYLVWQWNTLLLHVTKREMSTPSLLQEKDKVHKCNKNITILNTPQKSLGLHFIMSPYKINQLCLFKKEDFKKNLKVSFLQL